MISSIDYLDIDISDLLGKYIDVKKKNTIVLHDLKDNILFTTHFNYYDKKIASNTGYPSIDVINIRYLHHMVENKQDTINTINKIKHKKGGVTIDQKNNIWKVTEIYGVHFDKMYSSSRIKTDTIKEYIRKYNIDKYQDNLLVIDKKTGCKYISYPPHSRHYNSKDLIKHIKIK